MREVSTPLLGAAWQDTDVGGCSSVEGDWHLQDVARAQVDELKGIKSSW